MKTIQMTLDDELAATVDSEIRNVIGFALNL